MSGPQYPPPPKAGSNAIGRAGIGVSQLGDIPAFDVWTTILSQYANSPVITTIIQNLGADIDPTPRLNDFFDLIWNVASAQGYGLDVWGRIVGVNRAIHVQSSAWFGFSEALPGSLSFDNTQVFVYTPALGFSEGTNYYTFGYGSFGTSQQWSSNGQIQGGGAFYNGEALTSIYQLPDLTYRLLILAKAAFNITGGSIQAINQILMSLFPGRGNAYVTEGYQGASYFGFSESGNALTFGQGVFYNNETIQTMVMQYVFNFPLSAVEFSIVSQSGVLPKSTGVSASVVIQVP